ncbi:response regulator [Actinomadura rupiterrae]|uniref:response regulator n=1 Tax=Actinomadura rupiterrae TaxID=559627 RepID=UPI0020A3D772|nr:response regulator transcription factor [Actinomadura rupiterrae]MCP2334940.1 DNA-binding NarL/FixJ family response regulator [Actinomadura rupiterrae]
MTRVVVADDQALVRAGLAGILRTAPDLDVVGEAADGAEAVEAARALRPDVVLMDIRMPGTDGLAATREIAAAWTSRVLVLTTFDLDEYVYAALRGGASGFLLKDVPPAGLIDAVRVVAAGEALLAPSVTRRLIAEFAATPGRPRAEADGFGNLTVREREVLALVAEGLSNGEIADRLGIGAGTVRTHLGRLLAKLRARDRVQLVIIAFRAGLARVP